MDVTSAIDTALERNRAHAASFTGGGLPAPPALRLAVLTCMDARIHLDKVLGLGLGDAHILRNAGGRATDDAIRSLVVSTLLLGTREIMVIHHTGCGMGSYTNEEIRSEVRDRTGGDASGVDFLPFVDLDDSVREDVEAIRANPLLPDGITVRGFVYEIEMGALRPVHGV